MGVQALDQLSILPSPGLELGRMGPCCWLLPWWADEGLGIGRSRMGQNLLCACSCCCPGVYISSFPPQPFSLYFYKYIHRNIYDAKCNRDETPHLAGKSLCLHFPSDCNIPCSLGCPGATGQGAGSFTSFFIIIIVVLPISHFLLRAAGDQ